MKPDCPVFDKVWRADCLIERIGRAEGDAMIKRHYIGKWPGVCTLILGMRKKDAWSEFIGIVVFALPPRETSKRYGGETWELARLWLDDSVPQNAETWLIAKAVKYIRQNCPLVRILVSYADPSAGHGGTIYKAANWIADGRTDQERKTPIPASGIVDEGMCRKASRSSELRACRNIGLSTVWRLEMMEWTHVYNSLWFIITVLNIIILLHLM